MLRSVDGVSAWEVCLAVYQARLDDPDSVHTVDVVGSPVIAGWLAGQGLSGPTTGFESTA